MLQSLVTSKAKRGRRQQQQQQPQQKRTQPSNNFEGRAHDARLDYVGSGTTINRIIGHTNTTFTNITTLMFTSTIASTLCFNILYVIDGIRTLVMERCGFTLRLPVLLILEILFVIRARILLLVRLRILFTFINIYSRCIENTGNIRTDDSQHIVSMIIVIMFN